MYNIINSNDQAYKVLRVMSPSNFEDKDRSFNKELLGAWVKFEGGDHVLKKDNMILICETISEAEVIQPLEDVEVIEPTT
jgi:hypothetical protein